MTKTMIILLPLILAAAVTAAPKEAVESDMAKFAPQSLLAIAAQQHSSEKSARFLELIQEAKIRAIGDGTASLAAITLMESNTDDKLSTELRAAGCTDKYPFTYVPVGTNINFSNHMKRNRKPRKKMCGFYFFTDPTASLILNCDPVNVRPDSDFMVIYDPVNSIDQGVSDSTAAIVDMTINSHEVAVGLETRVGLMRTKSFECSITGVIA